jgi:purine nucleosidase
MPLSVVLDVDTGTDDAGALVLAVTCPTFELVGATATWGNCSRDQAARNTLAVLEAAGASDVPVFAGADRASGPTPSEASAGVVLRSDGLGAAGVADPQARPDPEAAVDALIRLTTERPGELTLVALAPLTTVAAALAADPGLPGRLHQLVVMGGAIAISGNITPAAEANIGHDPGAAARVIEAFGAPAALASGLPPRLVPLDVTLAGPLTEAELAGVETSSLPGTDLLHTIWTKIWPTGRFETGQDGVWPAHDLLATWCAADPSVCSWINVPLAVDTGRSVAWGATVADRRPERSSWPHRWDVAIAVDATRYRAGVRRWLAGGLV